MCARGSMCVCVCNQLKYVLRLRRNIWLTVKRVMSIVVGIDCFTVPVLNGNVFRSL